MNEKIPNPSERNVEQIPSSEEVRGVLERLTKGKKTRVTNEILDEQGNLYRLDAIIEGTEGESTEFFYRRKVSADKPPEINIHSAITYSDGYSTAGPQADFIDSEWRLLD